MAKRKYNPNPKTADSGIICAIPQAGRCPVKCADCFFQGAGRSYLEPLEDNLPNVPSVREAQGRVVRMNDGNDSSHEFDLVVATAEQYEDAFFNTSMTHRLADFPGPVVLTVNPGRMTDVRAHLVDPIPSNLMFVRVRVNTWNLALVDQVVAHYTQRGVPVVLTFMAYYTESVPPDHADKYVFQQRTTNSYWVVTPQVWDEIAGRYAGNRLVHTCGKNATTHACKHCGNCLREYFATKERLRAATG